MRFQVVMRTVVLLCTGCGSAQEITATISGTVVDARGARVPGVKITVLNADRNLIVRTLSTSDTGEYVAPLLPVGHYSVTAQTSGFKENKQIGIELNIGDRRVINFTLELEVVQEQVSVEAGQLQVDLQSPTAVGVITGTQVRELAVATRNFVQLVTLSPGISTGFDSDQLYVGFTNPNGGGVGEAGSPKYRAGAQSSRC